jgi:hypothetical protein
MSAIKAQEERYIRAVTDYLHRKENDLRELILKIEKKHGVEGKDKANLINSLRGTITQLESDLQVFENQLRSKSNQVTDFKEQLWRLQSDRNFLED